MAMLPGHSSTNRFDLPENTTGELTAILGADIEAVEVRCLLAAYYHTFYAFANNFNYQGLVGLPLGYRVRILTSLLTGVSIALAYSVQIGLVAILCVPLIGIAGMLQVCCLKKQKVQKPTKGPSPPTIMEQGLRGIASVQAYNLETKVGDDYARALEPESVGKVKSGIVAGEYTKDPLFCLTSNIFTEAY